MKPQPLAAISALLLLGDKYDLKVLRQDAIRVLHAGSPLDFTTPPTSLEIFPQVSGQRSTDFYIDLANILHESGIDTLLPIALLVILRSFDVISVLFHGADRSDGTRALLHPANTQIAVTGYYRLLALVQCRLYTLMPGPEQDCTNSTCLQHQIYFLTEVNRVGFVNHIDDMFIAPPDFFSGDLCERCDEFAQEHFSEGRKLLWTGLPSCFSAEYSWPKFRVKLAEVRHPLACVRRVSHWLCFSPDARMIQDFTYAQHRCRARAHKLSSDRGTDAHSLVEA